MMLKLIISVIVISVGNLCSAQNHYELVVSAVVGKNKGGWIIGEDMKIVGYTYGQYIVQFESGLTAKVDEDIVSIPMKVFMKYPDLNKRLNKQYNNTEIEKIESKSLRSAIKREEKALLEGKIKEEQDKGSKYKKLVGFWLMEKNQQEFFIKIEHIDPPPIAIYINERGLRAEFFEKNEDIVIKIYRVSKLINTLVWDRKFYAGWVNSRKNK